VQEHRPGAAEGAADARRRRAPRTGAGPRPVVGRRHLPGGARPLRTRPATWPRP